MFLHSHQAEELTGQETPFQPRQISGDACVDQNAGEAVAEVLCKASAKPEVGRIDAIAHLVRRRAVRAKLDLMALDPIKSQYEPNGTRMRKQALLAASSHHNLERAGARWYCWECECPDLHADVEWFAKS